MKAQLAGIIMVLIANTAWAQEGNLVNAHINDLTSFNDPAQAINKARGQWLVFSMPVVEGTRSPCCWKNHRNRNSEMGCSLDREHHSFGTRSDSPLTENVAVYARINGHQIDDLQVIGEQCPMDAQGAEVTWIGNTDDTAGLDWLASVARSNGNDSVGNLALYAIALHRDKKASDLLYEVAREQDGDHSEEAIFWLGDTRGAEGVKALKRLLRDLPASDLRREINFALSQNETQQALDLLIDISESDGDPQQRGNALFWLAEEHPDRAPEILLRAISHDADEDVREQAVFAISQLPPDIGTEMLLALAKDSDYPRDIRRQALFWLANSEDEKATTALAELLTP